MGGRTTGWSSRRCALQLKRKPFPRQEDRHICRHAGQESRASTKQKNSKNPQDHGTAESQTPAATPEEQLENAFQQIADDLAQQLLKHVLGNPPEFFEQLVVDLLLAMGYGGSREAAGRAIGRSGEEPDDD